MVKRKVEITISFYSDREATSHGSSDVVVSTVIEKPSKPERNKFVAHADWDG